MNAIVSELATGVTSMSPPEGEGARPRTNSNGAVLSSDVQRIKTENRYGLEAPHAYKHECNMHFIK